MRRLPPPHPCLVALVQSKNSPPPPAPPQVSRAINFFGPALLTHLLLPSLASAAPARVVNMSSLGEAFGRLAWHDLP